MARLAFKTSQKITIGVLVMFIGLSIVSSNYFNQKKYEVFDAMNELYYDHLVELELENDLDELVEAVEIENIETQSTPSSNIPTTTKPNEQISAQNGSTTTSTTGTTNKTTTTAKKPAVDYSQYYIGYLSIPKIDLKKGYTEINHKYNNVNRNIQVMPTSNYPDLNKGNMIIAAHSGTTSVSFFKDLHKLKLEDEVFITYHNNDYKYTIKSIYTVPKTGKVSIKRNANKTTLTLITCTKGDRETQTVYIAER